MHLRRKSTDKADTHPFMPGAPRLVQNLVVVSEEPTVSCWLVSPTSRTRQQSYQTDISSSSLILPTAHPKPPNLNSKPPRFWTWLQKGDFLRFLLRVKEERSAVKSGQKFHLQDCSQPHRSIIENRTPPSQQFYPPASTFISPSL